MKLVLSTHTFGAFNFLHHFNRFIYIRILTPLSPSTTSIAVLRTNLHYLDWEKKNNLPYHNFHPEAKSTAFFFPTHLFPVSILVCKLASGTEVQREPAGREHALKIPVISQRIYEPDRGHSPTSLFQCIYYDSSYEWKFHSCAFSCLNIYGRRPCCC
jgi:hypothetical protein